MSTCLTCRWRRPVGNDMPEANAANFKCTRFPRHEIYALDRVDSHSCGEWQVIDPETLVRYVLKHGH
jgi:hypothetical protein